METIINTIAMIVYKYDLYVIIAVAILNIYVFWKAKKIVKEGEKFIYPSGNKRFRIKVNIDSNPKEIENLQKEKVRALFWYSLYANLTAIFPLLGILGTVAALIQNSAETNMMDNLMVALNTTLLGIVFAVGFKVIDAAISSKLEEFADDVDDLIRKFDEEEDKSNEA